VDRYTRWNTLLELIRQRGQLGVAEAAAQLQVSEATIRRDFEQLAAQQLIQRTRGGASLGDVSPDLPLRYKTARHSAQKRRIGAAAARLVHPGMVVALGGGTTTTEAALALAARPELGGEPDSPQLTVVTNALNIANELLLRSRIKIVVAGGVLRPRSYELVGPLGSALLREITLDLVLLGVDGIDPRLGAAAHHEGEAAMHRLMVERARRVVILADASKLGESAFAQVCPARQVDTLITDTGADPALVAEFRAVGVEVITA